MIDFIFYTDCDTSTLPEYENVSYKKISFKDYCALVGMRLNIKYNIKSPYKLTDLKPFLGAVHMAELEGYDFWSFGDLDLCYGDLSKVVNEASLSKYELITTHCYHIAGHMTIMANNEYYRNLCFKIDNWERRLIEDRHYAFDENEWSMLVYPRLYIGRFLWKYLVRRLKVTDFFSFLDKYNRMFNPNQLFREFYTSPAPQPDEKWIYDTQTGRVVDPKGRELPYIHFLFFKKTPWFDTDCYWGKDFYQLEKNVERYPAIEISLNGIKPMHDGKIDQHTTKN